MPEQLIRINLGKGLNLSKLIQRKSYTLNGGLGNDTLVLTELFSRLG
jgi:hypothetical protein